MASRREDEVMSGSNPMARAEIKRSVLHDESGYIGKPDVMTIPPV